MNTMSTVSEILNKLKNEGYNIDFTLNKDCLIYSSNSFQIHHDEFEVDKRFRFEGDSDPAIIYAISSSKHNVKGILINVYGIQRKTMTELMDNRLNGTILLPDIMVNSDPAEEKSKSALPEEGYRTHL